MSDPVRNLPAAPRHARLDATRKPAYLKSIRIGSFGAFSERTVGPFSPHLNVVFGRNEAGKSTI